MATSRKQAWDAGLTGSVLYTAAILALSARTGGRVQPKRTAENVLVAVAIVSAMWFLGQH